MGTLQNERVLMERKLADAESKTNKMEEQMKEKVLVSGCFRNTFLLLFGLHISIFMPFLSGGLSLFPCTGLCSLVLVCVPLY